MTDRDAPDPKDSNLRAALTAPLFTVDSHGAYLRVTTPFTLPDGDTLILFLLRHSDPPQIGDLGETLRWLRSHTAEPLRSTRQQQQIVDACAGLGVALERGELRTHAGPGEPLARAVVRVAQACLRIAELRRTSRPRITRSFPDEVESYLHATLPGPLTITRNDRIPGISATTWSVDFRVRTPERHLLLFLLANERRDQARKLAEHVVAACTDLAHLRKLRRMPVQFITLFDDRGAAWNDADARLVAPFATPYRWSERKSWAPALADPELSPDLADDEDDSEPDAPTSNDEPSTNVGDDDSDDAPDMDRHDADITDDAPDTSDDDINEPDASDEDARDDIDEPEVSDEDAIDELDVSDEDAIADAPEPSDEHIIAHAPDTSDHIIAHAPDTGRDDDFTTPWDDRATEYDEAEPSLWGPPEALEPHPTVPASPALPTAPTSPTREPPMNLHMRLATVGDYPDFARLFPELANEDPVPDESAWSAHLHETTLLLTQGDETIGYVYYERMAEFGYVRNVVIDPRHRGRGVGRELMQRLAGHLRGLGCTRWCLNVSPHNPAALGLYRSMGLSMVYRSDAIRFDWSLVATLPAEDLALTTGPIDPREDDTIEDDHDLPPGQLAAIRDDPSRILLRLHDPENPHALGLGFASFNPDFPGAFPFRVARPGLARTLLLGLQPHALPEHPHMFVVVEDDEPLRAMLVAAGAELRYELLFLRGELP